ncbi:hypothetical protein T492DRAFT_80517 [Pavlovales sp. CCMP2436]|nr:hypothetical protein T492DRAFT_80517 [Pavlovales sp. CCMP2436]
MESSRLRRARPRRESDGQYVEFGSALRERPSIARQLELDSKEDGTPATVTGSPGSPGSSSSKRSVLHSSEVAEEEEVEGEEEAYLDEVWEAYRAEHLGRCRLSVAFNKWRAGHSEDSILSITRDPTILITPMRPRSSPLGSFDALSPERASVLRSLELLYSRLAALPRPSNKCHLQRLKAVISLADAEMWSVRGLGLEESPAPAGLRRDTLQLLLIRDAVERHAFREKKRGSAAGAGAGLRMSNIYSHQLRSSDGPSGGRLSAAPALSLARRCLQAVLRLPMAALALCRAAAVCWICLALRPVVAVLELLRLGWAVKMLVGFTGLPLLSPGALGTLLSTRSAGDHWPSAVQVRNPLPPNTFTSTNKFIYLKCTVWISPQPPES